MDANECLEVGHCRDGLYSHQTGLKRLKNVAAVASLALAVLLTASAITRAQTTPNPTAGMAQIEHNAALAPIIVSTLLGGTPASLPATSAFLDGSGAITTFIPTGPVTTGGNPFFDTSITANGRSCFTCHVPQSGWAISPPQIGTIYSSTAGKSPLFQPIDAANCPNTPGAAGPAGSAFVAAHSQLFNRGNFRIAINAPNPSGPAGQTTFNGSIPEWIMTVKSDPTNCENDPKYGLPAGLVGVYRRPLPSANVGFLNPGARGPNAFNIMWDAREPSLESQFVDATEFHGQAADPTILHPLDADDGAAFQFGLFVGQTTDFSAGDLTGGDGSGATGGPVNLFDSRLNIPLGGFGGGCFSPENLDGQDFCPGMFGIPNVFGEFSTFATATGKNAAQVAQRKSIARGETIFNTRSFTISNVPGLNDVTGPANGSQSASTGTCSTCHNNSSVGNDNFLDPKRTGVMDNSSTVLPPSSDFPLFAFYCPIAPFGSPGHMNFFSNPVTSSVCQQLPGSPTTCNEFDTTDPGVGLITGKCNDLGKMKVPVLRGLASRAPFFHGGNVATMAALVNFYNARFSIGLSAQDKTDLVNFLNTL